MKKVLTAAALMLAFASTSFAQQGIDSNDSKAKRKAKKARHEVKQGFKNTKSDVKAGVKAGKENKQTR